MPVRIYRSFDELPASYGKFFDEMAGRSFFLSLPWFKNIVETTLEPGAKLRLYAVEKDDSVSTAEVLLVARTPAGQEGSILYGRCMGTRTLAGMTNYQTCLFGPLVSSVVGKPYDLLRMLAEAIYREVPRWSVIDLNTMDCDSPLFNMVVEAFRTVGMVVRPYFFAGNLYEETEGISYRDYVRCRPKSVRKEYPRLMRRLEEAHRVRFELVTNGQALDASICAYEKVHAASWKKPEPHPHFVPGLIRACASEGALRLGILYVDEEPAAAQIWIVAADKATIYKISYNEVFKRFSIGSILMQHMMEHVIDIDRVREVDFGCYDAEYKRAWLSKRRELWGFVAFNPRTVWGALGLARHVIREGAYQMLKWGKPVLKPTYVTMKKLIEKSGKVTKTK